MRDRADELPPLSRADEERVWRDWQESRPHGDPLREWARRRLVKAGLRAADAEPGGDAADARGMGSVRHMRKRICDRWHPAR